MPENRIPLWLFAVVLLLWIASLLLGLLVFTTWEQRGQFGDLFGSANALFSGLAFAGLLYTISIQQKQFALQREELALQRDELRLQREEMKASRDELVAQTRAQRALYKATVAQIVVASAQARIEAQKLSATADPILGINQSIRFIEVTADALDSLANKLDLEE